MFTGIIETLAKVLERRKSGTNVDFTFESPITGELRVDQSVSHNGVCLTVTAIRDNTYSVTAIDETLKRSNLSALQPGEFVNIERCLAANGRFDGHIVQGHVDTVAICSEVKDLSGSWEFTFTYTAQNNFLTVEKGSITVNGVSLTVVNSERGKFSVHVIPYTFEHTNFKSIGPGSSVNIEFDIVGKYIAALARPHI